MAIHESERLNEVGHYIIDSSHIFSSKQMNEEMKLTCMSQRIRSDCNKIDHSFAHGFILNLSTVSKLYFPE